MILFRCISSVEWPQYATKFEVVRIPMTARFSADPPSHVAMVPRSVSRSRCKWHHAPAASPASPTWGLADRAPWLPLGREVGRQDHPRAPHRRWLDRTASAKPISFGPMPVRAGWVFPSTRNTGHESAGSLHRRLVSQRLDDAQLAAVASVQAIGADFGLGGEVWQRARYPDQSVDS